MTPDPIAQIPDNPDQMSAAAERQSSSWDIRNAPRNYISLVAYQIASALFSFGAVWLITQRLGSEGYGGIIAIIAASQVAQVFVNWTAIAVVRFGVDEFIETEKIARVFWTRLAILVINLALVLTLANFWFPPLAEWLKLSPNAFWLVMAHFAATVFWIHVQMSLQGAKMPRVQGLLQMVERLMIFAGLLILVTVGRLEFFWVIVCYIAAPTAMVVIGLIWIKSYVLTRFSIDTAMIRKIIGYSLPLLPFSLVGYFSGSYVDAVFVSKFLSTRDLGVYSVATQVSGITMQLPTLANSLLLPLFITLQKESGNERTYNYFRNILPSFTLFWGLACAFLSFVLWFAIPRIFGPEFNEAAFPLWILLAASVTVIPVVVGFSPLSNATSKTYVAMVAAIISALTNIVGNLILIPRYGLIGCAWSSLAAYFAGTLVYAVLLRGSAGMSIWRIMLAVLPTLGATVLLTVFSDPVWALAGCLVLSLLVGVWSRGSIGQLVPFFKNLRRAV